MASKLGLGDTPLAYWGQSMAEVPNVTITGNTLKFNKAMVALMGGARASIPAQNINIAVASGTVSYVYLVASNGVLSYAATSSPVTGRQRHHVPGDDHRYRLECDVDRLWPGYPFR
jgi:hypothetical protein